MKKHIVIIFSAILMLAMHMATAQSCCKKPTGMQALAFNKAFRASHEAPLPLNYVPEKGGVMIQFPVGGATPGNAFYVPADESTDKVLLIFHEWWGLNDYIKREAENWQKMLGGRVAVYAVDLYDGKVASAADEAGKIMGELDPKRGENIITGLLQNIGRNKKVATLGWCMGGSWAFTGTLLAHSQSVGCVMYYGFPEKEDGKIRQLKSDILYIRGDKDNFIKKSDVDEFAKKVKATGHQISVYSFDAVHAFANPSNPKYDEKSAAEAQKLALKFLEEKLLPQ